MVDLPTTESFSDFARRIGCKPSYVTALRLANRLVLTPDGKAVQVRESIDRIRATASPEWDGVAQRHADTRGAALGDAQVLPAAPSAHDLDDAGHADDDAPAAKAGQPQDDDQLRTRRAKRMSAELQAANDRLDYQLRTGKLVDADQARAAAAEMGTTVRRRLESLPTLVSSQVDERQRDHVFAFVTELVEDTLSDLERAFTRATTRKEPA